MPQLQTPHTGRWWWSGPVGCLKRPAGPLLVRVPAQIALENEDAYWTRMNRVGITVAPKGRIAAEFMAFNAFPRQ